MGITVNLVTYLIGTMHLPSSTSSKIVSDFAGTALLLCLLGGIIADSFLGKYWTIVTFSIINALGVGALALSTGLRQLRPPPCDATLPDKCKQASAFQMGIFYIALYATALGIGGIKSSVSGFGSEQFDDKDEKEKSQKTYFFNRIYFFINIGTLLAVTVLVYVQDNVGRCWAYGICSLSTCIMAVAFLSGTKRYRYQKCLGSPIIRILQNVVAAVRKRSLKLPSSPDLLFEDAPVGSRIGRTAQFRCLDKAAILVEEDHKTNESTSTPDPWRLCSVTRIEETKMVIRLLPIWATTIMYWTVHAQMLTFSVSQASSMDRSINKFLIPSGSFTGFFIATIMITISINDRVIMPLWMKWKGKQGFTNLQNIGVGLVFSILGMTAASLCERKRMAVAKSVEGTITTTLPISAFLLLPQFIIVGTGEGFMYSGQLNFFITQSPKGMKAMSTGLFQSTISFGYFVSSMLISLVKRVTGGRDGHGWLTDHINNGRLDLFYALLAVLSLINFGAYLLCASWYKPSTSEVDVALKDVVVVTGATGSDKNKE
ncbi:hypothetical protein Scep_008418 [Stephania cephalantha]|uniref:Uncharacterized protein n=1 Tax=Stephania cephalantha TaxID=152367 RepID=A0AAP0KBN2_9MAGN